MDEKMLVELWNTKRSQMTAVQMGPVIILGLIVALTTIGFFEDASDSARYFAIAIIAATGILATITQYAVIRESQALCIDLGRIKLPSEISKKIVASSSLLNLTLLAIVGIDVVVFTLACWAILGA